MASKRKYRYRCHWSDNWSQLGEPKRVHAKEKYALPFVYCYAENQSAAQKMVDDFNLAWGPPVIDFAPRAAHIPITFLRRFGFGEFFTAEQQSCEV